MLIVFIYTVCEFGNLLVVRNGGSSSSSNDNRNATTVVGTVSVAAEPCANGFGAYDMVACNECAENGKNQGYCCNAIYRHSLGRNDDDFSDGNEVAFCCDVNQDCKVGVDDCFPGLICVDDPNSVGANPKCQLNANDPNAHAAASSLVTSSSSTGNTTGGPSFVLVVVGLLGAAMMALTVVVQRHHRGLLRRHQYSAVDATTATRIDV